MKFPVINNYLTQKKEKKMAALVMHTRKINEFVKLTKNKLKIKKMN